jgi:hypothetical protein
LLGLLVLISFISLFVNPLSLTISWLTASFFIISALFLATPLRFYNFRTLKALLALPIGFAFMFLSLLSIRGANKQFIHTKHTYNAFQIKKKDR